MSENTENTENVLSAEDEADLQLLLQDPPPAPRTLLETWRELLASIEQAKAEKVGIALANRIVSTWPQLTYQDVTRYHERYHELLLELREILHAEISADPDCLKNVENDAVDNRRHYVNLLFCWQAASLRWEHEWDAASPDAAIEIAAIGDATGFFFGKPSPDGRGQQGLVDHLGAINLEFGDADREDMAARLTEIKAAL